MQKYFIFIVIAILSIGIFSVKSKEAKSEAKPKTEQMIVFKDDFDAMAFALQKKGRRVY